MSSVKSLASHSVMEIEARSSDEIGEAVVFMLQSGAEEVKIIETDDHYKVIGLRPLGN